MPVSAALSRFAAAPRLCGLALLACAAGQAVGGELPQSPACRTALAALEVAEATLAATARAASAALADTERQHAAAARLHPLRVRVANACLGGLTTSPPPSQHTPWIAQTPTRPAAPMPRLPTPPAVPVMTVPAPRVEAPLTVGTCNAAVCIASDGSTLTRVGPSLVGPRGVCSVQGGVLHCP